MNAYDLLNTQVQLANTAHQREVADLRAAGLNPVLSAHGSGADTPNIMSLADSSGSGGSSAKGLANAMKYSPTTQAMKLASKTVGMVPEMLNAVLNGNIKREPTSVTPVPSTRELLTGESNFKPTPWYSDEWNHLHVNDTPVLNWVVRNVLPGSISSPITRVTNTTARQAWYQPHEYDFEQAQRRLSYVNQG